MTTPDFHREIRIKTDYRTLFDAITDHLPLWWTPATEGRASRQGDEFVVHFRHFGRTRKKFRVVELIPDKKVVWHCLEALIDSPDLRNPHEWEGQQMSWEVLPDDDGTLLRFTHHGLNERQECWNLCEPGWDHSLSSLKQLVEAGTGKPFNRQQE